MRVGVSSRGSVWLNMGCLGWFFLWPFVVAGYAVYALCVGVAALARAITGAVREARPEPTAAKLERQARRHRIAGIVVLCLCGVIAVAMIAASV